MSTATVCPVVGTTNTTLPPTHPEIDSSLPDQVCPVTNATTTHHSNFVHSHPSLSSTPKDALDASACPALKDNITSPESLKLDEGICPVVGPVSTVLPPDHPQVATNDEGKECPVTKAKVGHHKGKVAEHPNTANAPEGARCPVAGVGKN